MVENTQQNPIPVHQQVQVDQAMAKEQSEFYKWLESMREELFDIILVWRGYAPKFDDNGRLVGTEKTTDALMSDAGIQEMSGFLSELLTKNTWISAVSIEKANLIIRQTGYTANDLLFDNQRRYTLDPSNYARVFMSTFNFISFAIYRAVEGKERLLIGRTTTISESKSFQSPQQGALRSLFGGRLF